MQQTDEQRLIARILDGRTEDYGYFMERYGENVFRLIARLVNTQEDAEELVQDAFVRAYLHLHDFTSEASFSSEKKSSGFMICQPDVFILSIMTVFLGREMLKSGDIASDSRKKTPFRKQYRCFFCIFAEKYEENEL